MTKFEKVAKRAELLGQAYQSIIEKDRWDKYDNAWTDDPILSDDKIEQHEYYMAVAKEIEKLL